MFVLGQKRYPYPRAHLFLGPPQPPTLIHAGLWPGRWEPRHPGFVRFISRNCQLPLLQQKGREERGGRGQGSDLWSLRSHVLTGGHIRGCTDKDTRLWSEWLGPPRGLSPHPLAGRGLSPNPEWPRSWQDPANLEG